MSMFTEGGQRRELCSVNVSSEGGGSITGICIHVKAILAMLLNIEESLQLGALFLHHRNANCAGFGRLPVSWQ